MNSGIQKSGKGRGTLLASAAAVMSLATAFSAQAQETSDSAWTHEVVYTADVIGPIDGGASKAGRFLDNLDLMADLDLDKAVGWSGGSAHIHVLNNSGGQPNDLVGSLQGVDNIEVSRQRTRLYELWLQQDFGHGSVRAGLYDLNSEFYVTDSSGLLMAPPFGIGSEFASTGPNGPSIFPSTTLAVRVRGEFGQGGYVQAAVLNANAGTIGDPHGLDMGLDRGALMIAEAGRDGRTRIAAGAWKYSRKQDDIRDLAANGDPAHADAQGLYVLAEQEWSAPDAPGARVRSFVRVGVSDGDTSPFRGGWQAGLLVEKVFAGRPDSAFSIGVEQGLLSSKHRANGADAGFDLGSAESSLEITYSDKLTERLTIQPDLQYIRRPGGDRDADDAIVAGLRLTLDLS